MKWLLISAALAIGTIIGLLMFLVHAMEKV